MNANAKLPAVYNKNPESLSQSETAEEFSISSVWFKYSEGSSALREYKQMKRHCGKYRL